MSERIFASAEELIGNTPLLRLSRICAKYAPKAEILAKCEWTNPAGSIKDRVAKAILDKAEQEGKLTKDTLIIEPTSGNTGIGLSAIAAMRGYRVLIVMPSSMSPERVKIMSAYGAEVVLTDGKLGMAGAVAYANERKAKEPNAIIAGQFYNPANPYAHFVSTGPEIVRDTEGKVDVFLAGVGTGGTITGVGQYLKTHIPGVRIFAVEPKSSPVLSEGKGGAHGIQGIGAGFVPEVLDTFVYEEVITVTDEDAYRFARETAKTEGIMVGISGGAAICAAIQLAKRDEFQDKRIVTVLPDSGSRYLSTDLYE